MYITFPKDALDLAEDILAKRVEFDTVGLLTHLAKRHANGETESPFLYDHLVITAWIKGGGNLTSLCRKAADLHKAEDSPVPTYIGLLKANLLPGNKQNPVAKKMIEAISLACAAWLERH